MVFKGSNKTQCNKRLFLQCYMHSGANITLASDNAKVSRQHEYSWLKKDVAFRMAKEQIDFGTVSFTISKLLQKAKSGDVQALKILKNRSEKKTI